MNQKIDETEFMRYVDDENLHIYHLRIVKDSSLIYSRDWREVKKRDVHSVSKTFVSTAVGFAKSEGLLSLNESVVECFPEDIPNVVSDKMQRMQLRHLLTMTMGFKKPLLTMEERPQLRTTRQNWIKDVLATEVAEEPGEKFLYNNAGPYLLSVLLTRRTGMPVTEYLKPRLFDKIGLSDVHTQEYCPLGYELGASGMMLDIHDLVKFGVFYLQEGRWNGEQILDQEWIQEATSLHIRRGNKNGEEITAQQATTIGSGYGYQIWIGPNEEWYYFIGSYDTMVLVLPKKNAVIAVVSKEVEKEGEVLKALNRFVIPSL